MYPREGDRPAGAGQDGRRVLAYAVPALVLVLAILALRPVATDARMVADPASPSPAQALPARVPGATPPTLTITPSDAQAGWTITIQGAGYPVTCGSDGRVSIIRLLWDDGPVLAYVDQVSLEGDFRATARVPSDAPPGDHAISSDCVVRVRNDERPVEQLARATTSLRVVEPPTIPPTVPPTIAPTPTTQPTSRPTTRPTIAPTPSPSVLGATFPPRPAGGVIAAPSEPPSAEIGRSRVPVALRAPSASSDALRRALVSLLFAALMFLVLGFPAELFNSTYEEHSDEIAGWFDLVRFHSAGLRARLAAMPSSIGFVLFGVAAGVMLAFLDPTFGLNLRSLVFALGLITAVFVVTLAAEIPPMAYAHRLGLHGRLATYPQATVLAGMCVAISRLLGFVPGYAFGVTAGYQPEGGELSDRDAGRSAALGASSVLGLSIAAWLVWGPIDVAAERAGAGFGLLFLDALVSSVVLIALGGLVFTLLPFRFCDGDKVRRWSLRVWISLFGASLFAFVYIIASPEQSGSSDVASMAKAMTLFLAFGLGSVGFWAYFRYRKPREPQASIASEAAVPVGVGARDDDRLP